jgi:diguanylate cyclase (GGDEF)-like protein
VYLFSALVVYLYVRGIIKPLSDMAITVLNSSESNDKEMMLPTHLNSEIGLLAQALEAKSKQLSYLTIYDGITGLINRSAFYDRLVKSIKHSCRKNSVVCVLYLDVNNFKYVNDTYGHDCDDELLKNIAQILLDNSRANEACGRLGSDHFAIIIEENTLDNNAIENILQRYQDALNKTYVIKGVVLNILMAGGLCLYPVDAQNADELIMKAERALNISKAKQNGAFVRYHNGSGEL